MHRYGTFGNDPSFVGSADRNFSCNHSKRHRNEIVKISLELEKKVLTGNCVCTVLAATK